jgi:glucose-6-phosphate isomerase
VTRVRRDACVALAVGPGSGKARGTTNGFGIVTSNRFSPGSAPLRLDISRAFVPFTVVSRTELIALNDRMASVRRALDGAGDAGSEGNTAGGDCVPLLDVPGRLLADYKRLRRTSQLGRILAAGKRIRESADRVVIVGGKMELAVVRALLSIGCHPYHNELSRGDRGGRPRMYFTGDDFDNDALQGLLDLMAHDRGSADAGNRWTIVVIDGEQDRNGPVAALQCLLATGGGPKNEGRISAAITRAGSAMGRMARTACATEIFDWPSGLEARFALFTAAGLLPASLMGLDVVQLLRGGAAMTDRFRLSPPGDNPPLDVAATVQAVGAHVPLSPGGRGVRGEGAVEFSTPVASLAAVATWCNRLHAKVSESRAAALRINLLTDALRRDHLIVPPSAGAGQAHFEPAAGTSFAELQRAAFDTARTVPAGDARPQVDIVLPSLEENAIGQLLQMMLLAAAAGERFASGCE